jgi:hypothetical protein
MRADKKGSSQNSSKRKKNIGKLTGSPDDEGSTHL